MYSVKRWKEVLTIVSGKNQKAVENPDGKYPIYGSGGVIGRANDYLCKEQTVIVGRKGTINNPIFVSEPFWNIDTAFGVVAGDELIPKFLYYFCCLFNFKTLDKSTGRPSLAKSDLMKIEMPVPPLPEQERIVARIEELFSELDKAVETLQTTKRQLEVYRQAVLKEVFGTVTQYVPLGTVSESRLGKMLDKKKNIGTYRQYLRNQNVRWFSIDESDLLEMRFEDEELEKYSLKAGDLVICEGGEPGRCAVWDKDESICYQKALHRVRFYRGANPKLYMYYFWFLAQTGELGSYYTGTGINHLTGESLVKVRVPDIEVEQQTRLVEIIESRLSVCDSIEQTVDSALSQADALRQSILKEAFEGRL